MKYYLIKEINDPTRMNLEKNGAASKTYLFGKRYASLNDPYHSTSDYSVEDIREFAEGFGYTRKCDAVRMKNIMEFDHSTSEIDRKYWNSTYEVMEVTT